MRLLRKGIAPYLTPVALVNSGGNMASDPTVRKLGATYYQVWTDYNPDTSPGTTILAAGTSPEGQVWIPVTSSINPTGVFGAVLKGSTPPAYDEQLETGSLLSTGGSNWRLYFIGKDDVNAWPTSIGLATSSNNCQTFTRTAAQIVAPTPNGYDHEGCVSPSVVAVDVASYVMLYTGHNYTGADLTKRGVHLLAATSTDGVTWTKVPTPLFSSGAMAMDWCVDGIAEVDVALLPDGRWIMFFTGLQGDTGRRLGYGVANSPLGPYNLYHSPVLSPSVEQQIIAPTIVVDSPLIKVWYLSYNQPADYKVRYATGELATFAGLSAS